MPMCCGVPCQNHDTGRIHVEPVNDPRVWEALLRAAFDAVAMFGSLAWHAQEPARLVDHQKIVICV